jgi:hypothetical protein
MTYKYSLDKIRKSRNEFEALLRIYGVATSKKFLEDPTRVRFIHAKRLADYLGLKIQDIVDTIVYDLK